jgi:3-isopropylmalate/(R)-2-methylmalate dehydratase small subunit
LQLRTTQGQVLACEPIPGFLLDMVAAGGLLNQLRQRLSSGQVSTQSKDSA